jgi:hypothetical protein
MKPEYMAGSIDDLAPGRLQDPDLGVVPDHESVRPRLALVAADGDVATEER